MSTVTPSKTQPLLAAAIAVLGIAMTTWAAFAHAAHFVVPGATLITFGAAWLGNILARMDVRFFPSRNPQADDEAS